MPLENDFLPFAVGSSANVESQAAYAANTSLLQGGFASGIAPSVQLNKVWRQSSIAAAVLAQFIVNNSGQTAIDDGTTATLLANFTNAVNAASKNKIVLTDTGMANAYAAANPVPLTALPTATGFTQTVKIAHANTGASTYAPDGLATAPIYGLGGTVMQGGEMPTNGIATLVSFVDPLLNSGSLCWVLYECVGGAQQIAPATQSEHALQAGQALGLFLGVQEFTSSSTYTPGTYTVGGRSVTATRAKFRWVGGGGGGGGCGAPNSAQASVANGGNGGAYMEAIITTGLTSQAITIGAGGGAGAAGFNFGSAGGNSVVGTIGTAIGGAGGAAGGGGAPPTINTGQANSGGGAVGGGITVNKGSALGQFGIAISLTVVLGGQGGDSPFGAGGKGGSSSSPSNQYGAGGGGANQTASGGAVAGAAGIGGYCIVEEFA